MKKKAFIAAIVLILVLIATYSLSWFKVYRMTEGYYQQAEANFEKGKYALALKGGNDFATGEFIGAYQQVIEAWEGKGVFPHPGIYYQAKEMADLIIQKQLTPKDIDAMVKKYLKQDKRYLDTALFRKAEIYQEEGNTAKAIEAYETIIEVFSIKKDLAEKAQERIDQLKES